jgi:hypothetical protein
LPGGCAAWRGRTGGRWLRSDWAGGLRFIRSAGW